MLEGCTIDSSNGSMRTRPLSISARMSLSERSTSRGYAERAGHPQSERHPRARPTGLAAYRPTA